MTDISHESRHEQHPDVAHVAVANLMLVAVFCVTQRLMLLLVAVFGSVQLILATTTNSKGGIMDKNLQKYMDDCHMWILPKGTIIYYEGLPYYLNSNIEVLGNNEPEKFIPPSEEDLRRFWES